MKNERALIEQILGRPAGQADGLQQQGVLLGPGDDAGVLFRGEGDLVVSTDLSVEGVHFRLDWISPAEAGRRAVAAALSDLAAMGARPRAILLSLADHDADRLVAAGAAARAFAESLGIPVLGGDISRGSALTIDVVVIGESARPLTRSGATPGQEVWVTGALGAPALALSQWLAGIEPDPGARTRFTSPEPRMAEMLWLSEQAGVTAAIDLSDGLLVDAGRMAQACELGLALDRSAIPVHASVSAAASADQRASLPLLGGEEYEVLFTVEAMDQVIQEAFRATFSVPLTRIGRTVAGGGVTVDGISVDPAGFDHFGRPE